LSSREISVDIVNRLDKFWSNQEVMYNYKVDLHGMKP